MTVDEVRLCALQIMEQIWDLPDHKWGDTHTTELNKKAAESGVAFLSRLIKTEGAQGQIGAYLTLCLVSKAGDALVREFCACDVVPSILKSLHSADPILKLSAAEILKNFTTFEQLTDANKKYVDSLDLVRNMVDVFYSTDDNKIINLILTGFLNLAKIPKLRVSTLVHLRKL